MENHRSRILKTSLAPLALAMLLGGCVSTGLRYPQALGAKGASGTEEAEQVATAETTPEPAARLRVGNAPVQPEGRAQVAAGKGEAATAPGDLVTVNVDQMTIKTFAQFVYGQLLKKSVTLDAKLAQRTDLISLRADNPQSPRQVADTAKLLLQGYGVTVTEFDGMVRVNAADTRGGELPLLRRGRASAETPMALRPVFHLVELEATRSTEVIGWLKTMFGNRVDMQDAATANSILLSGVPENVQAALDIVRALDAPRMRGRIAKRVVPAHMSAAEMVARLNEVLTAQGYSVGGLNGAFNAGGLPILLVPVTALNTVYVFTASQSVAEHVMKWAEEVDQPPPKAASSGFLSYAVKYSDANALAKTMSDLMSAGTVQPVAPVATGPSGGASTTMASRVFGRVVVNPATNSLIIQGGTPDEHRQWRALLNELDRPVKSALIDVVVAEVTLGAKENLGLEWQMEPQVLSNGVVRGGTLGGLGLGNTGLGLSFLNSAGQVRGVLNFLGSSSQSRVLSSPKVLARNAETATIQVGQEVPIVTSQQSGIAATAASTTGVLQTIQYRSTGVILRVKPTILAGGRIDLEVTQEVSNAAETTTGVVTSPTISTRRVETKLALRDGGTVMLAGLISSDSSDGNSGVPGLKDVPGLGALFKNSKLSNNKTELVIMITGHILNDDFETEAITDSFRRSLSDWLGAGDGPGGKPLARPAAPAGKPQSAAAAGQPVPQAPGKEVAPLVVPRQDDPPVLEAPARPAGRTGAAAPAASSVVPPAGPAGAAASAPQTAQQPKPAGAPGAGGDGDTGLGRPVTDPALIEEIKRSAGKR